MRNGWIKLNRHLCDHWLWLSEPFSRGQAWVDLLMLASSKDHKYLYKGQLVEVKRGDVVTSEIALAERWKWSRGKVRRFLNVLEADNMVTVKRTRGGTTGGTTNGTTLTIENYSVWQGARPTVEPSNGTTNDTTDGHNKEYIEKDKEVNNITSGIGNITDRSIDHVHPPTDLPSRNEINDRLAAMRARIKAVNEAYGLDEHGRPKNERSRE